MWVSTRETNLKLVEERGTKSVEGCEQQAISSTEKHRNHVTNEEKSFVAVCAICFSSAC